jgi:predicted S18 family serine protease
MAMKLNKDSILRTLKNTLGALGQRMDYVLLGLLGATTLGVIIFYVSEVSSPVPVVVEPQPRPLMIRISAAEGHPRSGAYFDAFELVEAIEPLDQTEYQNLIDFNMFDPRAARDAEQLHDEAQVKLKEAESRFDQGNYEQARRLAQEALSQAPMMQAAVRLLEKIDARAPSQEAEASPPTEEAQEEEGAPAEANEAAGP